MKQPVRSMEEKEKKPKRYGYDSSTYSAKPTESLNAFLSTVLPSLDVVLMPGERDPAIPTLPQQPVHKGMLLDASKFQNMEAVTNPCWLKIDGTSYVVLQHDCGIC